MLLIRWNAFQPEAIQNATLQTVETQTVLPVETNGSENSDIPVVIQSGVQSKPENIEVFENKLITVSTDTLNITIDTLGGDIVNASLPKFPTTQEENSPPFQIMERTSNILYIAQSGLIGANGLDNQKTRPLFQSKQTAYVMKEGEPLSVDLDITTSDGVVITKRFIFSPESYLIEIQYIINNKMDKAWSGNLFAQIKRDDHQPEVSSGFGIKPFHGAAITTEEQNYKKLSLDDISEQEFKQSINGGWVAFIQHYFLSAWVPDKNSTNNYSIRKMKNSNIYIFGFIGDEKVIPPGSKDIISTKLYIGPKDVKKLEEISDYLDLTVDYGWLWWIAKPLHTILSSAHAILGNWGWSIICLTLIIKMIFFPLSNKAYLSMAAMRKVTPKMMEIREKYGDNRQKLQEEMMKLYRSEKINPLGGCLPMLIQMPVFISLYWTLLESVEIRQAPFMGWITDLSVMDPYFCLPLLMGVSMFLQQKMNPTPPDPTQAKVMQLLPVMFTFMFLWFPAGLVLYWLVNNIISMIHQAYINHKVEGSIVRK